MHIELVHCTTIKYITYTNTYLIYISCITHSYNEVYTISTLNYNEIYMYIVLIHWIIMKCVCILYILNYSEMYTLNYNTMNTLVVCTLNYNETYTLNLCTELYNEKCIHWATIKYIHWNYTWNFNIMKCIRILYILNLYIELQ